MKKNNFDGWVEQTQSLGINGISLNSNYSLDSKYFSYLYETDWVVQKVVSIPAFYSFKNGITFKTDTEIDIMKIERAFEDLEIENKLIDALQWSDLLGGSVILMGINDGAINLSEPVNENNIKSIEYLKVYDKSDVVVVRGTDINNFRTYNEPEYYQIGNSNIHHSRILHFDGLKLPDINKDNDGFGTSKIPLFYNQLTQFHQMSETITKLILDSKIDIMYVKGLSDLISTDGTEGVKERLRAYRDIATAFNVKLFDSGIDKEDITEKMERIQFNFSGIDNLVQKFMELISASTGFPLTLLMGVQTKGLGNGGEADLTNFYDKIEGIQKYKIRPQLNKLFNYVVKMIYGNNSKIWYEFNPLTSPTEEEKTNIAFKVIEGIVKGYEANLIDYEEARTNLMNTEAVQNLDLTKTEEPLNVDEVKKTIQADEIQKIKIAMDEKLIKDEKLEVIKMIEELK